MSALFQPLTLRSITFKNRLAVSPMCMYSSTDGFATNWHLVHLGSRAVGGAGLVLTEATAVSPEGRITPDDLGIWKDEHVVMLKRLATCIQEQGAVAGIQLAHAGRKASTKSPWKGGGPVPGAEGGWQTVAPSAVPFNAGEPIPEALTQAGIAKVISDFKEAAKRSLDAGFQVVEIHAAHGYLLHEFMSPLSNNRTDAYGGSFENRIRLLLEIIEQVRQVWPQEYPLWVRISATDWTEGGWTDEGSVKLAGILAELEVDLIDCSSGGNVPHAKIPVEPGYQVRFAQSIKQNTSIKTGAVGMITTAEQAEEIVASGQADVVLVAREMLRDPYFATHAALALGADTTWPPQYERAKPRLHASTTPSDTNKR